MLDEAGFTETKIIASNDLDEETITGLKAQRPKSRFLGRWYKADYRIRSTSIRCSI